MIPDLSVDGTDDVAPEKRDLAPAAPARGRLILLAMCLALVAVVASVSGLNVAQGELAVDLGASQNTLLWIINGYTLVLAALLLPIGAVGDRWGRKPVLLGGLTVFAVANVVAAFAENSATMLAARLLGGVGAAMIMPVTLSIITSSFPDAERPRAVGIWAAFAGAGGIMGLFFSSAMIDWFTWPWVFAMPVALCLASFVLSVRVVDNSREPAHHRFDLGGSVLSALAIGGLILAIHEGPEHGWTAPLTLVGLIGGVVMTAGFIGWEQRVEHPLLDLSVFRERALAAGSLTLMLVFAVMFGLFLALVQFLQAVLGYSALRASAGLLPMALLMMPLSSASPAMVRRIGTRAVLVLGISLLAAGMVAMALFSTMERGYFGVVPGLLMIAVGAGLAMTPSTIAITESLPQERQGVASAINDTARELGGALGVALLGSMLSTGYRHGISEAAAALPDPVRAPVEQGIGSALAVAPQLGEAGGAIVLAARQAFVDGWHSAMWAGAAVALAGVVVAWRLTPTGTVARSGDEAEHGRR